MKRWRYQHSWFHSNDHQTVLRWTPNNKLKWIILSNKINCAWLKRSRSLHIICDFKLGTATSRSIMIRQLLFWKGFHSLCNKRKTCFFFSRLALSVTCTSTPGLSGDYCLPDDGMLEPGILHSTAVVYFSFHTDTDLNLREHYHISFTACVFLRCHHQRAMSKWCGVLRSATLSKLLLPYKYDDVIMGAMASLITSLTIVYWTVYSDTDQRKHQSSASLAFVWGFHRGPGNSPHNWPVTRKIFPFYNVIMSWSIPGLCASSANTGRNSLRGSHHFTLLTLCVGSPSHCWMFFSPGRKCRTCMGWDGVLISS